MSGSVTVVSDVYNSSLQLVEMCSERVWSPVCDNWTLQDATVICRELGYTSLGMKPFTPDYYSHLLQDKAQCSMAICMLI